MDHIPLASGARPPALSIPFVVKSASDSPYCHGEDDFISFPERHLQELRFIHRDLGPEDALLSLAQSWLYFGTLTEFFQQPINSNTLTRLDHTGDRLVCTSSLRELRSRWIASLPPRSITGPGFRQRIGRRCGVLLARATWAYEHFQDMITEDPRAPLVMFSIKVMLCSLCHTARVVLYPTPTLDAVLARLSPRPAAVDDSTATDFLLWDYMVQNGWCPYQMNHLATLHSATSMIYLASIPRRKRNIGHENCLRAGCCKASQIDWAAFEPLHVTAGCTCEHVSVDEQQIMAKLEDYKIPLLSCTRSASGDFSIEVIQADTHTVFGTPTFYYAISHVWADGLGNPLANSLAKCQFERLYNKLKSLSNEVAMTRPFSGTIALSESVRSGSPIVFWMDVFCIPVVRENSERNSKLKQRAIALMDLTYAFARQVLVLDSEMELVAAQDGSDDELSRLKASTETLSRFATCSWMGRSWTLQEGALASELWAHYSGHPMRHKSFYSFDLSPHLVNEVPPEMLAVIETLANHASLPSVGRGTQDMTNAAAYCSSAREVQFLEVWNSLIGRSTTQPEDFHCIVANLLDFSVQELFKLKGSDGSDQENRYERMKAIILAQKRLPMQLFCLPTTRADNSSEMAWLPERPIGPRLSEDAFAHSVKVVHGGFVMEPACLTFCFFAWPLHSSTLGFCLNIPSKNGAHPHITLHLPRSTNMENLDLLVYLNASTQVHTLLTDSRKNGAAFFVTDRQNDSVKVKYLCSLSFRNCWEAHGSVGAPDYIAAAAVSKKVSVCISGPDTHTALKFRRPLRVGSNLTATLPAKSIVIAAILGLITAISLATIIALPPTRKFFFNRPVIRYSALLFYALLIVLFLFYITALLFVCARYMSAPWIRKSYSTDQLPWYVRALYWEKLPSILKISMWTRRMHQALVTRLLDRRIPYEIPTDLPRRERTTLLWRLKRVAMSPWRRTQNANGLPQDYTDDYDGDIPLLPSSEPDPAFRGVQASSPLSPPSDLSEVDAFDCVGEENARILRTVRRALIATRADGTGNGMWDIFNDVIVATQWIGRIGKQRKLRDILFDYGFIRGGK